MSSERRPHRVVVTGLGTVTSIGTSATEFLTGLRTGRSGVKPITAFDTTGYAYANGCEIEGFDPAEWIERVDPGELGRAGQFSVAAARMAVSDAGMGLEELRARRVLVSVGTTDGESHDLDGLMESQLSVGPEHLDPVVARRSAAGMLSSSIVRELELRDVEAVTIPTACAAGNYAIGSGFDAIRAGEVDVALSGGADAVCRKTFTGFYRLGTIAPDVCRPFDADRKGILTGEGAGILFLESLESALARGARIYAEILGYGLNCDAHHPVAPDQDSLAACIELAHRNAGVKPEDIDFISAHGTGTKANDVTEAGAIRQVFADPPPTVSIKSMLGHTMGAASALASAACALAITEGFIPPTINHRRTDPECGVDPVPNEARPADVRIVQNNALAFAGNNAVVILGRYEPAAADRSEPGSVDPSESAAAGPYEPETAA
ncbi:beta-ketoacyl-[acyl-carrier-protein] synthase family protein [Streptomyces sp. NPDC002773]|uniref:beta-ketoacyl-[acyl-carrier-protein] synthase family protein n=1 Tax=Streptomyces sp. NPDC002773 TaxID=3154430 RepID=UPI003333C339